MPLPDEKKLWQKCLIVVALFVAVISLFNGVPLWIVVLSKSSFVTLYYTRFIYLPLILKHNLGAYLHLYLYYGQVWPVAAVHIILLYVQHYIYIYFLYI